MDHFPVPKGPDSFSKVEGGLNLPSTEKNGSQVALLKGGGTCSCRGPRCWPVPQKYQSHLPLFSLHQKHSLVCSLGVLHNHRHAGSSTEAFPILSTLCCPKQSLGSFWLSLKSALCHSSNPTTCVTPRTLWTHTCLWGPLVNRHTPLAFLFPLLDLDGKLVHRVRGQALHQCPSVGHLLVIPPCRFPLFPIANIILPGTRKTSGKWKVACGSLALAEPERDRDALLSGSLLGFREEPAKVQTAKNQQQQNPAYFFLLLMECECFHPKGWTALSRLLLKTLSSPGESCSIFWTEPGILGGLQTTISLPHGHEHGQISGRPLLPE